MGKNNIDDYLGGRYHEIYERLGVKKGHQGGNWHCPFLDGHLGVDAHGSFSISNETGCYHCFTCNHSGNLITFLKKKGIDVKPFLAELGVPTSSIPKKNKKKKGWRHE